MKEFVDFFFSIDLAIFNFFNSFIQNELINLILPYLSNIQSFPWFKFVVGPILLGLWFWRQKMRALRVFLALLIVGGLTDTIAYRVVKPEVKRVRPNNNPQINSNLRLYGPKSYSFPSNHATNGMGAAYTLSWYYPGLRIAFYGLAVAVGLSRIYGGVHYPSDVLAGWLLGFLIAYFLKQSLFRQVSFFNSSRRIW